jgi:hypothetical protein
MLTKTKSKMFSKNSRFTRKWFSFAVTVLVRYIKKFETKILLSLLNRHTPYKR